MEGKKALEVKKIKMQTVKFKNSKCSHKGGFTIIETLVAVTVLMIAISGPLVVASKGLTTALYARDQVIASYLAQETMEMIKNIRDNNLGKAVPDTWLSGIKDGDECVSTSDRCKISPIESYAECSDSPSCAVYYSDSNGYTYYSAGSKTIFSRYYYLTEPGVDTPCLTTATECQVHVVVSWNEGTVPYDVTLTSELVNNLR